VSLRSRLVDWRALLQVQPVLLAQACANRKGSLHRLAKGEEATESGFGLWMKTGFMFTHEYLEQYSTLVQLSPEHCGFSSAEVATFEAEQRHREADGQHAEEPFDVLALRRLCVPTLSQHGELLNILIYIRATIVLHMDATPTVTFERVQGLGQILLELSTPERPLVLNAVAPPSAGFCESIDIGINTMLAAEAEGFFAYQQTGYTDLTNASLAGCMMQRCLEQNTDCKGVPVDGLWGFTQAASSSSASSPSSSPSAVPWLKPKEEGGGLRFVPAATLAMSGKECMGMRDFEGEAGCLSAAELKSAADEWGWYWQLYEAEGEAGLAEAYSRAASAVRIPDRPACLGTAPTWGTGATRWSFHPLLGQKEASQKIVGVHDMAKTMAAVVEVKEATVWIVKAKLDAPPPVVVPAVQLLDTDKLENVVLPPTYGEIKEASAKRQLSATNYEGGSERPHDEAADKLQLWQEGQQQIHLNLTAFGAVPNMVAKEEVYGTERMVFGGQGPSIARFIAEYQMGSGRVINLRITNNWHALGMWAGWRRSGWDLESWFASQKTRSASLYANALAKVHPARVEPAGAGGKRKRR